MTLYLFYDFENIFGLFIGFENNDNEDEDEEDENLDQPLTSWKEFELLSQFSRWLVSPDRKSKNTCQAKQHVRQVEVILQDSSQHSFELEFLFNQQSIRDKWLLTFEQKRKPGTVKSYLHSLIFFYKVILCDESEECARFILKCNSMIAAMESWLGRYRKQVQHTRWKKDLLQLTQLFKVSEIKASDNSDYVRYCQSTIYKIRRSRKAPVFKEFTAVLGYMLMYLCFDNTSRTGALANMSCQEYLNATYSDGSYKVALLDHKTLTTFEPCVLVFTSALYEEARVFYHQFRNSLEGIDIKRYDDKFFMSWSGKRVSSSMVSVQLNSFWGKGVGHTKERPRITATLVRKSVVSKVRTQKLELGKYLADLMCHSEDTAKRS